MTTLPARTQAATVAQPGLPAAPVGQAANPRGLEPGAGFWPGTVSGILNRFPIVLNSKN
jgi:hypothetical protein